MCEVVHTRATCTQLLHDCYDCYRLKRADRQTRGSHWQFGPMGEAAIAMGTSIAMTQS
jgi:hypothetical protein